MQQKDSLASAIPHIRTALNTWFNTHERQGLPWRENRTPYRVWLAEIMLQQTTVTTVIPYFNNFIHHFPTLEELAAASLDDVLTHWQGLGYYSRARNLHACAKKLTNEYGNKWPVTEEELIKLPGIGPYTAAALAALAFNKPTVIVDGNIERICARLWAEDTPLPKSKPLLKAHANTLVPPKNTGRFAECLMDFANTVCLPKKPLCSSCPLRECCTAYKQGNPETYPKRAPKTKVPHKKGNVYVIRKGNMLWLQQRPEKGLLGGLWEFPHSDWETASPHASIKLFIAAHTAHSVGSVTHVFSHFKLTLNVHVITTQDTPPSEGMFYNEGALPPLSTLMRKVYTRAARAL